MQNQLQPDSRLYTLKFDPILVEGDQGENERLHKSVEALNQSLKSTVGDNSGKSQLLDELSYPIPIPGLLQGKALIFLLANLPEEEIGELLYMKIQEFLEQKNKHQQSVFNETPTFYPENKPVAKVSEEHRKIIDNEMEMMGAISQSLLLFHHYTANLEFISSRTFEIHLAISRFWASLLSGWFKVKNLPFEPGEKNSSFCSLASRFLELSLRIITYMKAENAWTYKDLKEKNRFSELRETAVWKEFITAESRKSCSKTGKQDSALDNEVVNQANQNEHAEHWFGFLSNVAGFEVTEKGLSLLPVLPEKWVSWSMKLHFRKAVIDMGFTERNFHVSNISEQPINLNVFGKELTLNPGQNKTIKL